MLEKMNEFFDKRLDGYDTHMMTNIESADVFYPFTAGLLPKTDNAKILDLGCGTGLELEYYFKINPSAKITGIDLTQSMLDALQQKFPEKELTLICDSYLMCRLVNAALMPPFRLNRCIISKRKRNCRFIQSFARH